MSGTIKTGTQLVNGVPTDYNFPDPFGDISVDSSMNVNGVPRDYTKSPAEGSVSTGTMLVNAVSTEYNFPVTTGFGSFRSFSPLDLGVDLLRWLDVSDIASLLNSSLVIPADTDPVAEIRDLQNNGVVFEQSTISQMPTYDAVSKGLVFTSSSLSIMQGVTTGAGSPTLPPNDTQYFIVASTGAVAGTLWAPARSNEEQIFRVRVRANGDLDVRTTSEDTADTTEDFQSIALESPAPTVPFLVSGKLQFPNHDSFLNGVSQGSTVNALDRWVTGATNGVIGGTGLPSNYSDSIIHEIVATSDLTTDTRERLEGYMYHRWKGVLPTLPELPPSHPFRNSAP